MEGPLGVRSQYGDQGQRGGQGLGLGAKARAREGGRGQGPGPRAQYPKAA